MSHHISRVALRPDATLADLRRHKILRLDAYGLHQLVWKLAGRNDNQKRDFIYRADNDSDGLPILTIVSEQPLNTGDDVWNITTKHYSPVIRNGERLAFTLRCNPVKAEYNADNVELKRRGNRIDIMGSAHRSDMANGIRRPRRILHLEESYSWLDRRGGQNGFMIVADSLVVDNYSVDDHPKDKTKKLSMLDVSGMLQVLDGQTFTSMLLSGLGHAKAWGCGLMLVRRQG